MLSLRQSAKFRPIPTPVNENLGWQDVINRVPGVIQFEKGTLPYLSVVLSRFQSEDPYLCCPAYHAFTGRYGLWAYAKGKSVLLFARHPNLANTLIFYPQFGNSFPNLAADFLSQINLPGFDFMFARYPAEYAEFMTASMNKAGAAYHYDAVKEEVLDWTYPVHTLSTKLVTEAKGKNFKSFRYDIHRVEEQNIKAVPMTGDADDIQELSTVIKAWSENKLDLDDPAETIQSYLYMLELMQISSLNMSGLKFYDGEKLIAFEIWSVPDNKNKVANNLAGMNINAVENLQGFSSYQYYTVCKELLNQGIEHVCIGGSETAGLDHFKRKMSPVRSLSLLSIHAHKKNIASEQAAS